MSRGAAIARKEKRVIVNEVARPKVPTRGQKWPLRGIAGWAEDDGSIGAHHAPMFDLTACTASVADNPDLRIPSFRAGPAQPLSAPAYAAAPDTAPGSRGGSPAPLSSADEPGEPMPLSPVMRATWVAAILLTWFAACGAILAFRGCH